MVLVFGEGVSKVSRHFGDRFLSSVLSSCFPIDDWRAEAATG